jgi:hypothetical protein
VNRDWVVVVEANEGDQKAPLGALISACRVNLTKAPWE